MKKNTVLIIASCLIGIVTAFAYSSRIRHLRDEIKYSSEEIQVLTVTRDIAPGEFLKVEDLAVTRLIKKQVSKRTVSPGDLELIIGSQLIHPIPSNDPILWTDFPEGPRIQYPSEKILPGYRVLALPADEIHTLVHFISPGDTVDIVSSTFDNSGDHLHSRVIAKEIVVLGIGHKLVGQPSRSAPGDYPLSVSLMVDPETALIILRASQVGELHFLARGSNPILKFDNLKNYKTPGKNLQGGKP